MGQQKYEFVSTETRGRITNALGTEPIEIRPISIPGRGRRAGYGVPLKFGYESVANERDEPNTSSHELTVSVQTLKRKCITSPSWTTYSLPSSRILPFSLAPASPLQAMKSA